MKRRRKSNPRRRVAARSRSTAVRVITRRRRARVGVSRRRHNRRRNPMPSFFGSTANMRGLGTVLGGGLVGVAATKIIPGLLPAGIIPAGGAWMNVLVSGVIAYASGTAATKFVGAAFGQAVMFGGLMQTASAAINAISPKLAFRGVPLALSGMGEFMPGQFPVPQNPLRTLPPAPAQARITMSGLARSYGNAF